MLSGHGACHRAGSASAEIACSSAADLLGGARHGTAFRGDFALDCEGVRPRDLGQLCLPKTPPDGHSDIFAAPQAAFENHPLPVHSTQGSEYALILRTQKLFVLQHIDFELLVASRCRNQAQRSCFLLQNCLLGEPNATSNFGDRISGARHGALLRYAANFAQRAVSEQIFGELVEPLLVLFDKNCNFFSSCGVGAARAVLLGLLSLLLARSADHHSGREATHHPDRGST
mmetsp:Transcript_37093/g.78673  ORF Transcript_37093/g.78673 Transcript_37093/m.78673 type:complete len:230 (-) Transcript_37093:19-708(-)